MFIYLILFREITIDEYDNDGDESGIKVDKNLMQKNTKNNNNQMGSFTAPSNNNNTGSLIDEFSNIFGAPATNNQNQNNNNTDMNNIFGADSSNSNTESAKPSSNQYDLLSGFLNNTNQNTDTNNPNPTNNNIPQNKNNNDLLSNLGLVNINIFFF